MQPPVYIDTNEALARLARRAEGQTAIAVDTESNSLFAYRERLCLVQISAGGRDYVVDPLAEPDLEPLAPVFADPAVLKVFHDAEYDVLTLKRAYPFEFAAIFDTKVAASALGMTRVGLAALLAEFAGVTLDKRHQRSDWGKRPLPRAQIDYARLDTHYLLRVARELRRRLWQAGAPAVLEVAAECRRLAGLVPEPRRFDPDEFARIKGAEALGERSRRALRELFVMRHEIADERDSPAFKVLTNDMLIALARARPRDREALRGVRAVSAKLAQRYGERIVATIRRAERLRPIAELPAPRTELSQLTPRQRAVFERLRAWRKQAAAKRRTDPALVLPRPTMLALSRLRPAPRTPDQLAATGLLAPWQVRFHGEAILAELAEAEP